MLKQAIYNRHKVAAVDIKRTLLGIPKSMLVGAGTAGLATHLLNEGWTNAPFVNLFKKQFQAVGLDNMVDRAAKKLELDEINRQTKNMLKDHYPDGISKAKGDINIAINPSDVAENVRLDQGLYRDVMRRAAIKGGVLGAAFSNVYTKPQLTFKQKLQRSLGINK